MEQAGDGIVEVEIVKEPYEDPIVVLFREGKDLGVRLDAFAEGRDHSWWEQQAFELAEGEPYIDAETNEEQIVRGPPVRFPVSPEELGPLLLAALLEFLGLPPDRELIATENGA